MKKKSQKIDVIPVKRVVYTPEELERMAWSLVKRGLASRAIIEPGYSKPQFNRGSRHGDHSAYERKFKNDGI